MLKGNDARNLIVGIDPGTGSTSGAGIALIDINTNELLAARSIWMPSSSKVPAWKRIREIAAVIASELLVKAPATSDVFIESFVMRGKGGETLARFVGAVIAGIPNGVEFKEVSNLRVKKLVAGRGDDDKQAVAEAVHDYFSHSPTSLDIIEELIIAEDFDALDAIAIGIAGLKEQQAVHG